MKDQDDATVLNELETKIKQLEKQDMDTADAAGLIEECVRLAAELGQ